MSNEHVKLVHAVGINTSAIDSLLENLAKDLVELEQQKTDSSVLKTVTETYQQIYNNLIDIKRGG